ncbi:MAG: hypothetical protein ACK587_14040 [Cyanobacteriota bacterium]
MRDSNYSKSSRKALLVFPDAHLRYSPSAINAATVLVEHGFDVTIICVSNHYASPGLGPQIHVKAISLPEFSHRLPARLKLFHAVGFFLLAIKACSFGFKNKPNIVIGFDARGYLASRLASRKAAYFSLETIHDFYHSFSRFLGVQTLIIQSQLRKTFLFNRQSSMNVWYVPNSPLSDHQSLPSRPSIKDGPIELVYCGGLIASNFSIECIDLLNQDPRYQLTIKGPANPDYLGFISEKYRPFLHSGRLRIDTSYESQADLVQYLASFHVGICIYPTIVFDDFNYLTSPSGKMYSYFAAQLPCVGSLVPGLSEIEHYRAGILVDQLSPQSLHSAIKRIASDYLLFKRGCAEAAEKLDFRRAFSSFLAAHSCA